MKSGWILILFWILSSCGAEKRLTPPRGTHFELDENFTRTERNNILGDLNAIEGFDVSPRGTSDEPMVDDWFERVFGGQSTDHVLDYLDRRINYFVPHSNDWLQRVYKEGESFSRSSTMVGFNLGTHLFFLNSINGGGFRYEFNNKRIPLEDTRVGIVSLGDYYLLRPFLSSNGKKINRTNSFYSAVLVHEARHSDCTGGITRQALSEIPQSRSFLGFLCGHAHKDCSDDHDLAGLPACDSRPWGAYGVEAVFSARLASCTDCTEEFKQEATINALDAISRLELEQDLYSGAYGAPDMSSDRLIR